jgi:site-specific recombinase XerD
MAKSKRKRTPKTVLKLPDLEQSKSAVLNSLTSPSSQRSYDHAIREFIEWYCSEPRLAFNKTVVTRYRISLEQRRYAPSTINLRLAAVRRLAYEAADCGLLSADLAAGIRRVKGAKRLGVRVGNWLTAEQGKRLLMAADEASLRGRRDYAMLAVLLGCGLRRAELTGLRIEDLQLREEHWVIADLVGKGGHVRTIPMPDWVKAGVDNWVAAAGITTGPLLRSINKAGRIWGNGFSPKVIWGVVKDKAASCEFPSLAPHDLRRTCARLCHQAGGELEQIQFLLGHVSVQTTGSDCSQTSLELSRFGSAGRLLKTTPNLLGHLFSAWPCEGRFLPAIFNVGSFPDPLPWLFLRRPIDIACDMLPIPFPALGFDPSTRFRIGPTPGSGHAH